MSFKLGTTNNRAILIQDENYYDVEKLSEGKISSDSVQALESIDELKKLASSLTDFPSSGKLSEIELGLSLIHI